MIKVTLYPPKFRVHFTNFSLGFLTFSVLKKEKRGQFVHLEISSVCVPFLLLKNRRADLSSRFICYTVLVI